MARSSDATLRAAAQLAVLGHIADFRSTVDGCLEVLSWPGVDDHQRAFAHAQIASARAFRGSYEEFLPHYDGALLLGAATGNEEAVALAEFAAAFRALLADDLDTARHHNARGVDAAKDRPMTVFSRVNPAWHQSFITTYDDDLATTEAILRDAIFDSHRVGERVWRYRNQCNLFNALYWAGRLDEAEALAHEIEITPNRSVWMRTATTSGLAMVRAHRGDLETALRLQSDAMQRVAGAAPDLGAAEVTTHNLIVAELAGDVATAQFFLDILWDPDLSIRFSSMWDVQILHFVRINRASRHLKSAMTRMVAMLDTRVSNSARERRSSPSAWCAGMGRRSPKGCRCSSAHHADDAARGAPRRGRRRCHPGSPRAGRHVGVGGMELATGIGADGEARRFASIAGRHAPSPRSAWDLLTATEAHIAAAVADGQSNRAIADAFYVSPRTVETHVSSILRKTGCRNRTALAIAYRSRAQ